MSDAPATPAPWLAVLERLGPAVGTSAQPALARWQPDRDLAQALAQRAQDAGLAESGLLVGLLALLAGKLGGLEEAVVADLGTGDRRRIALPRAWRLERWLASLGSNGHVDASAPAALGYWVDGTGSPAPAPGLSARIDTGGPLGVTLALAGPGASDSAVAALVDALAALAQHLTSAVPRATLADLSILTTAQDRQLLAWGRGAPRDFAADSLIRRFLACSREHGERIAVIDSERSLSYRELEAAARRQRLQLAAAGVGAGDRVGLYGGRSADMVAAMLAVGWLGAAYVPLDPVLGSSRLTHMVRDADVRLLLADSRCGPPPELERPVLPLAAPDAPDDDAGWSAPEDRADRLAYIMYTSGTTGIAKGVAVRQRGILRLVCEADYLRLGAPVRILHAAPLGFDAATLEVWGAVLTGATCVVHRPALIDGPELAATLAQHRVDTAWLTASLFNALIDDDPGHLAPLRQLAIGGEALSPSHVRRAQQALPQLQLINGYGPTEATTFTATHAIPRELPPGPVAVGRPIPDTQVHVVNGLGEALPPGCVGELWIGGGGVADGYVNQPALTAERFLPDPSGGAAVGARLYRSGDRFAFDADGLLHYHGRIDHQLKLRGFRVEPGEIEATLSQVPGVAACAVALDPRPGDKRLVAWYVAGDPAPTTAGLRLAAEDLLPEFMRPSRWQPVSALPRTANGKLDRTALPAPDADRPELGIDYAPARSPTESTLCRLFAELLGLDQVGIDDPLFAFGGNSLMALRLLTAIRRELPGALSLARLLAAPTPRAIAAALTGSGRAGNRPDPAPAVDTATPVAIIAMAGRFPGADDIEAFWRNLCAGIDSITRFTPDQLDASLPASLRSDPAYVPARGVIADVECFDAAFFGIPAREAELMDPQQRLLLELSWTCLERAGYVPERSGGEVGVFAGMYNASYLRHHLSAHPDRVARFGEFQVMLANEKDYVATRIAHRLNLTGPAISVHTACSTSLVAICQAFDAIRLGHCQLALAGGAAITCPPASGYLYQDGAMLSPDGHTRPFSDDAAGTVFSDGAAMVLLKRLDRALADGDPVIAVIEGAAVNNDGGDKASFTAPSCDGQAAVIARALQVAGIDPSQIGYIEAHGTATPLGDPIEIEGLNRVFAGVDTQAGRRRVGSVKSNIGHLVIAAGAAGVIKAGLALQHRTLPASLHFRAANPQIDFAASPFRVQDRLEPWPEDLPLRAGVSSFGVGGTNAHVVLAPPPPMAPGTEPAGPVLLALSARSPEQLADQARRLAGHLRTHPGDLLADAAHTLAVGRRHFRQRLALVADGRADAIARLDAAAAAGTPAEPLASSVVFAFPGQGAQYPGMASTLYRHAGPFRAALDQCAAILARHGLPDLLDHLASTEADRLRPTAISQPAIFAVEYALARWWQSLAVEPAALVGHSLGEFVAATLGGIFELDDALHLVCLRGALMQAQPAGAMLAVRLPAAELAPRLGAELALAADNGPRACVLSGPQAAVDRIAAELAADGVACASLRTSHAFHSAMMDPVVEPFRRALDRIRLSAPQLPIVSTVTGDWLVEAEATDPEYWAMHLRRPVRFAQAAARLLETPDRLLLEVGPGNVLGGLFRQMQARARTVACLPGPFDSEVQGALAAVAAAWQAGIEVDLTALDRDPARRRIRLPTYPFARTRHWLPAAAGTDARAGSPAVPERAPEPAVEPTMVTPGADTATAAAATGADPSRAQLVQRLIAMFDDVAGIELDPEATALGFLEQGVDSLALTQVALQIKADFGVPISFRDLMENCASLDLLASALAARIPARIAPAPGALSSQPQTAVRSTPAVGAPAIAPVAPTPRPIPATPAAQPAAASDGNDGNEESALAHTRYDVKKAFGAIARIHPGESELTSRQQARLAAFIRRYTERTARSKAHVQAHRAHLADPRVVNGFRPMFKEIVYQIVVERSRGARLWDLDGNEYIDALNGFGMNLFGWQPPVVTDALRRTLDSGYEIGPQHPLAGEVARLVCELTGNDRTALCNTGSEAVMGTVRIARTITGRRLVVVFSGAYHGIFDEVIVRSTSQRRSVPAAPGIMRSAMDNVLVLDWGSDEALQVIRERADEIAAVLVEPVQSRRPDFQPFDFLRQLRELTTETGALLVFDEVVTGFRCHPGGIQALIGVRADLCAYGKVVGGGLPIGVISGKRQYMDALDGGWWQFGDDSTPTVGVTYFAGTFVRHPLALVAAQAVLEHLRDEGPALQTQLNERSAGLAKAMNDIALRAGAPLVVHHFASVLKLEFQQEHPLQDLLFAMMRSHGVHLLDHFPCFLTTAHGPVELERIATAFGSALDEMLESGFMARTVDRTRELDASNPPVPGARLGRDEQRRPAWFVPNPEQPGKYMKVEA